MEIGSLSWAQEAAEGHKSRWTTADSAQLLNDFAKDLSQRMNSTSRGSRSPSICALHRVLSREKIEREEIERETERSKTLQGVGRHFFFFFFNEQQEEKDIKEKRKQRTCAFYFTVSTSPPLLKDSKMLGGSVSTLIVFPVNEAWNLLSENTVSMYSHTLSSPHVVPRGLCL